MLLPGKPHTRSSAMRGSTRAGSSALCLIPDRLGTAVTLCPWAFHPLLLLVLASSSSGSIGGPATAAHPPAAAPFPSPSEQTAEGLGGQCTGASLASAALRGEEVKIPIPALRKQLWDVHEAHEPPTVGREAFVLCWIAVCHEIILAGEAVTEMDEQQKANFDRQNFHMFGQSSLPSLRNLQCLHPKHGSLL